jgi:hypothetical protein
MEKILINVSNVIKREFWVLKECVYVINNMKKINLMEVNAFLDFNVKINCVLYANFKTDSFYAWNVNKDIFWRVQISAKNAILSVKNVKTTPSPAQNVMVIYI